MDSAKLVVSVRFILLVAVFTLVFARLIAPADGGRSSEFRGDEADIPLRSRARS
jgi:hypothetical protein